MKMRNLILGLGFVAGSAMLAQGPLYDKVIVNLQYPVTVNDTVLQPGEYVIRQHESAAGGSRVLHFFTDQGMKLETTAMAIPALDNRTPTETKLVLEHIGNDYYLNKIWVQGKDYGYEFPIPNSIRMREKERSTSSTVVARYEAAPAPAETVAQTQTTTTEETAKQSTTTETAQNTTPAPVAAQPEPTPAPEPVQQAQSEPPAATAPATAEAADRGTRTMPSTAGNWLNLLLGGGFLSSAGFALRKFRS